MLATAHVCDMPRGRAYSAGAVTGTKSLPHARLLTLRAMIVRPPANHIRPSMTVNFCQVADFKSVREATDDNFHRVKASWMMIVL